MKRIAKALCIILLAVSAISLIACAPQNPQSGASTTSTIPPAATITITTTVTVLAGNTLPSTTPETIPTTPTKTQTPSCSSVTATQNLPQTPSTSVSQVTLQDRGMIFVSGQGYFKYQRVFGRIEEPTEYEGVVFAPYVSDKTIIAPVPFWLVAHFADGAAEELQYVGLGDVGSIVMRFTQHESPKAGVILLWQQIEGSLRSVLYLLVCI